MYLWLKTNHFSFLKLHALKRVAKSTFKIAPFYKPKIRFSGKVAGC